VKKGTCQLLPPQYLKTSVAEVPIECPWSQCCYFIIQKYKVVNPGERCQIRFWYKITVAFYKLHQFINVSIICHSVVKTWSLQNRSETIKSFVRSTPRGQCYKITVFNYHGNFNPIFSWVKMTQFIVPF